MKLLALAALLTFQLLFVNAQFVKVTFADTNCLVKEFTEFNNANTNGTCFLNTRITCNSTHMISTLYQNSDCSGGTSVTIKRLETCAVDFVKAEKFYCGKNLPAKTTFNHISALTYNTELTCQNNGQILSETQYETGEFFEFFNG
jgi:hypothetical protein